MPTVALSLTSPLTPAEVLRVITDFGPDRSTNWPGVDDKHLQVHGSGPDWADVTEGNDATWERERYSWDAAAGTISAVTSDSNVWGPGSRWDYKLTPSGVGTKVDITLHRVGKGLKGRLIGAVLPLAGKSVIAKSFAGPLKTS